MITKGKNMREKLISLLLMIIITVVPVTILPDAKEYNMLRICVLLLCGAALLILMFSNYKKLKLDKNDYWILAFGGLVFLSTIFSNNIARSIIGATNRYEGMFTFFTYIIIYLCTKKFMTLKTKKILIIIVHIVYILISILGICQYYIKMPTDNLIPIFNKGATGTLGNTNFMGNFVSMGIPIFIILYIINGNKVSLITSLLVFFNLIVCCARSGWVAFATFCIMLLIYLIKNKNIKYLVRTIILVVCFTVVFTCIYLEKNSIVKTKISVVKDDVKIIQNEIKNNSGKNHVKTNINSIGSFRVQIWKIVIELMQKYPLFGIGTDNLAQGICCNLTETSMDFISKTRTLPDKAHNEYLHIAVTIGFPAMIIYLIFLGSIMLPKIKMVFNEEYIFILFSVVISYLAQAFFNISTIGVAPLFWMTLGLLDN